MGKAAVLSSHHDNAIRSKLLNRLGIYKNVPVRGNGPEAQKRKHVIRTASHSSEAPSMTNAMPFRAPLNDSGIHSLRERSRSSSSSMSSGNGTLEKGKRSIHFDSNVLVVPIPSRHEYSSRIKKFLWSNGAEIQQNAERNRIEFASEGWNWKNVLEDDDMYVDSLTGELVHPCWFGELQAMQGSVEETKEVDNEDDDEAYLDFPKPSLARSNSFLSNMMQGISE